MSLKFSIIVPVAPEREAPVLNSIKKLNYNKKDYEIIIKKGKNPSINRNEGVKEAKSKILLFLDDDAYIPSDLLKNAEDFFQKYPDVDVVGGPQLTPKDDPYFAKTSGYVVSSYFGTYGMSTRYKKTKLNLNASETHLSSAICFIKKNLFKKTHGFNPDLFPGEDPELFSRLKSLNFKIAYSPDLYIYHKRRTNFKSFFKQFFLYGKVRLKKENIGKTKTNLVFFAPFLFVLYLIFLIPISFISIYFIIPLAIYILTDLILSLFITIKNKDLLALPLLPFLFPAVHISYGLGMLYSLFK